MKKINDGLQSAILDNCRQGEAAKLGKDPASFTFSDCSLMADDLAQDFCYECFATAYKYLGEEENREVVCLKIKDKTLSLSCN
jgi:glucan biosynthesis protein